MGLSITMVEKSITPVIDEVKEQRLALESISKLKTILFLHISYQTDPRTKLLDCKNIVHLWETIDDYPPSLKITKELMEYVNFKNLHDLENINDITTYISHEKFKRLEVGESSTQAIQQKLDSPMEVEFSKGHMEETQSEDDKYFPIYSFKKIGSSLPTPPLPCVKVHVLATKFSRPKKVIAYNDDSSILLVESWVTRAAYFIVADGNVFGIDLMTK
ncbi:hypothetical protein KIW84_011234 [Lathyrus oleraceus]|uniref:Uncharacterized protein n=1 Tax=Pisum sativum TaxID=3888 RepID=A0A9D5BAQ8_PEA|nr:hypothetical protein KIW84_011234 [Pisum sativum]